MPEGQMRGKVNKVFLILNADGYQALNDIQKAF